MSLQKFLLTVNDYNKLMHLYTRKLLLTGRPGIGKTTVIKRLAQRLAPFKPSGFYTEEIRQEGIRMGFAIKRLNGSDAGILAHVDIKGPYRVGRYGVDIEGFERFLSEIEVEVLTSQIILIDEIGKMECYSQRFRTLIETLLFSDKFLVFTIAQKGSGFIETVKKAEGIGIVEITEQNRERIVSEIEERIRSWLYQGF